MNNAFNIYQEMKELSHSKKVIEARYEKLKKETIATFLTNAEEIVSPEGLVIITYKAHSVNQFQQTIFKEENVSLYEKYCLETMQKKFLLK